MSRWREGRSSFRGGNYLQVLAWAHGRMRPRTYVEVGVNKGKSVSLALPDTVVAAIDPTPKISWPITRRTTVLEMTSDCAFDEGHVDRVLAGRSVELAFVDGLHQAEVALRDYLNIEQRTVRGSAVLFHDCLPEDEAMAARERGEARRWTGDVWKVVEWIRRHRPSLCVDVFDSPPSGLALITGFGLDVSDEAKELGQDLEAATFGDFVAVRSDWAPVAPSGDLLADRMPAASRVRLPLPMAKALRHRRRSRGRA